MKSFLTAAIAVLPLVAAAPTTAAGVDRRTPGNVFLCTGSGWSNTCTNLFVGIGNDWRANCQRLAEPYYKSVGSMGPDRGALCRLWDGAHSDCTGSGIAIIESPGNANLYAGSDAGHNAEYISCVTCTNCQN